MGQEPGTEEEIKRFATERYGAKFQLFSKINVNGEDTHPVYRFLRCTSRLWNTSKNQAELIPWNFAKFIVNEEGKVVSYHEPQESPSSLEDKISAML